MKLSHIIDKVITNILVYKTFFLALLKRGQNFIWSQVKAPGRVYTFFYKLFLAPARRPETDNFFLGLRVLQCNAILAYVK